MTHTKKRFFTACCFSQKTRENIEKKIQTILPLAHGLKRVPPEQIHLSIHFFPHLSEKEYACVSDVYSRIVSSCEPIQITITSVGVFPSIHKPRVLWLGIDDGSAALAQLKERLDVPLKKYRISLEDRAFKPHITIGRFKPKKRSLLLEQTVCGEFPDSISARVDGVQIIESTLTQREPIHTVRTLCLCKEVI